MQVEKLLHQVPGKDAQLVTAWNGIADHYAERQKWHKVTL